jgi:hypothetical protein
MKAISVSLLLLTLVSSTLIITVEESNATSKAEEIEEEAEDTGDNIREGGKDLRKTINEGLRELGGKSSNNYNDNENIQNEFDNSKDKENNNDKVSIADEIREFSKLKQEGILSDKEFTEMKEDVFNNNRNENDDFSVADK